MSWLVAIKEAILIFSEVFGLIREAWKKIDRSTWESNKAERKKKRQEAWDAYRKGNTEKLRDLFR